MRRKQRHTIHTIFRLKIYPRLLLSFVYSSIATPIPTRSSQPAIVMPSPSTRRDNVTTHAALAKRASRRGHDSKTTAIGASNNGNNLFLAIQNGKRTNVECSTPAPTQSDNQSGQNSEYFTMRGGHRHHAANFVCSLISLYRIFRCNRYGFGRYRCGTHEQYVFRETISVFQ